MYRCWEHWKNHVTGNLDENSSYVPSLKTMVKSEATPAPGYVIICHIFAKFRWNLRKPTQTVTCHDDTICCVILEVFSIYISKSYNSNEISCKIHWKFTIKVSIRSCLMLLKTASAAASIPVCTVPPSKRSVSFEWNQEISAKTHPPTLITSD